jgi:putative flippase GtrA
MRSTPARVLALATPTISGNHEGMLEKFSKFASVGLCATSVQYAILIFLVEALDFEKIVASTIGFLVSAASSYLLNRRFTFHSTERHIVAAPKFLTIALAGAALNAGLIGWFEAHVKITYILVQAMATIAVLSWNFAANVAWTFRTS